MGWITPVSVIVNALAAVAVALFGRRVVKQRQKIEETERALAVIATGLQVVEQAVEENKDILQKTGAGDRIVRTIRAYGPAAKQVVDLARQAAANLRQKSVSDYEAAVIAQETFEHAAREAELAKSGE
jgi:uncharacterized protein YoxC